MATMTHTGPIGIEQINTTFYVWGGGGVGFNTVQAAVDYVRTQLGTGLIVVLQNHVASDDITAVTGGVAPIIILDQRGGADQRWQWNGTNYIPQTFVQEGGFAATGNVTQPFGSLAMTFNPIGGVNDAGGGGIRLVANQNKGIPFFSIQMVPGDGSIPEEAVIQIGEDLIAPGTYTTQILEKLRILVTEDTEAVWIGQQQDTGGKGMSVVPSAANNQVSLQGKTQGQAYDQAIYLNPLGGDVVVSPLGSTSMKNVAISGTCTVGGSPVRTLANTPNAIAQVYPASGLAVSTGSAWGASINPATLVTYPAAGLAVSTGSAWGAPIDPATLQGKLTLTTTGSSGPATLTGSALNIPQYAGGGMVFPAAGIGVSTGSAWGTSINPATLATYPPAGIPNSTGSAWGTAINPATLATYPPAGIAVSTGSAWGTAISPSNVPLLNVVNTFTTDQTVTGTVTAGSSMLRLGYYGATGAGFDTGSANIIADPFNLVLNTHNGTGSVYFNFNQGTGGVKFANGAQTVVATVDAAGNAHFNGTLGATGAKTFIIPHPLDETKDLYHACLEGPENGVYYRGEAQVVDGYAVVTLPDYFEALTFPEDRSVQLTQIWEDVPLFARLAASRVVDGKFTIHATDDVTVAWEVKAVRRIGVDRLKVVQDKPEPQPAQ